MICNIYLIPAVQLQIYPGDYFLFWEDGKLSVEKSETLTADGFTWSGNKVKKQGIHHLHVSTVKAETNPVDFDIIYPGILFSTLRSIVNRRPEADFIPAGFLNYFAANFNMGNPLSECVVTEKKLLDFDPQKFEAVYKNYHLKPLKDQFTWEELELAYKLGYEDRDKDIGYGSNLPYFKEQVNLKS